ncbi:hypothetical protein XPA_000690 [Xanthoria parietina]
MDALSLTLRSVTSSKAAQIKRQETHFKEERLSLQSILDCEPNGNKRLKAILKTYSQFPLMPQTNTSRDKFIATIEKYLERTVPDPCAPIAQWERRLKAIIDSQCLRYEHANLYKDILKEWRDSTDEPEKLIDDSSFEVEDLCQSKDAIVKWLQGVFASTQASTKALEDLRAGVALFERTMKENKGHFTKSSMNWCIWGLLRSDLLTDEKRRVLTVIQQDEDALQDVIDDINMRMNTLDQWAWPTEGVTAEQRRQVGSKYRISHDEDLIDALLLRYVGVKWSVQMSERLVAFAKAHTWLSPLNTVSRNDRTRRDHFLGPTTDHSAGVQGQRLKTFEDDFFLAQLLRHEKEVDRGYEDDFEQEDRNRGLQTRQSITELKHSLLQLLNVGITVRKRLDDEVTVVQSDFKAFGTSIPHTTISAVLTFFGVSQSWTEFIIKALAVPIVFREDGPEAEVRKRRRSTHMSSPLADFCSELLMFGMDFAVWQCTSGLRLYRLHDDFWLWGSEDACVRGWSDMADFAKVMGLAFNAEKSGAIRVSRTTRTPLSSSLPRGDVSWGFLKLSSSGYFVLDNALLDKHITALIAQLASSKSLFAWIRIWNTYGVRYFMSMLGGERPASCFGAQHIALMQQCFARMHQKVFQDEANVANYLRKEIKGDSPERNSYEKSKTLYEQGRTVGLAQSRYTPHRPGFFPFKELVRAREQLSHDLLKAYKALLDRPKPVKVVTSDEVEAVLGGSQGLEGSYDLCLLELYKDGLVANFGGLNIVETKLLPMGMVAMARKERIKWNV